MPIRLTPPEPRAKIGGPKGYVSIFSPEGQCDMVLDHPRRWVIAVLVAGVAVLWLGRVSARAEQPLDPIHRPYDLDTGLVSRSLLKHPCSIRVSSVAK